MRKCRLTLCGCDERNSWQDRLLLGITGYNGLDEGEAAVSDVRGGDLWSTLTQRGEQLTTQLNILGKASRTGQQRQWDGFEKIRGIARRSNP